MYTLKSASTESSEKSRMGGGESTSSSSLRHSSPTKTEPPSALGKKNIYLCINTMHISYGVTMDDPVLLPLSRGTLGAMFLVKKSS